MALQGQAEFEKLVRQHLTRFLRDHMPRPADTPRARQVPGHLTPEAIIALRKSYLTWLMEQVRAVPLAGIDPKSIREETRRDLDLAAVYTALMTQRSEDTIGPGVTPSGPGGRGEREQLSALAMANAEPRLALLGDPGSGKSTFVNFMALCMAGELLGHPDANLAALRAAVPKDDEAHRDRRETQLQPWDHGPLIPIRVILREFVARACSRLARPLRSPARPCGMISLKRCRRHSATLPTPGAMSWNAPEVCSCSTGWTRCRRPTSADHKSNRRSNSLRPSFPTYGYWSPVAPTPINGRIGS